MSTVVIVDDQTINLRILSRFAQSLEDNVVVRTFEMAEHALASIAEEAPDLIVTDYVMPSMSGDEFIHECRELLGDLDVPIIVVTAYEDRNFRYRALDSGATDFLLSPVDGREFCIRARNLLTMWHHQQEIRKRAIVLESELAAKMRQHADDIRQRELKLRRVINTVPALVSASDATGHIVFLNSHHKQIFDFDWANAVGHSTTELFGEAFGEHLQTLDREVLKTGRMIAGVEFTVVDKSGRERVLLTTKAPFCGSEDNVDHVVTVSLDITERKQGEQAVRESEERFRNLVEGSLLGIVIDNGGRAVFANQTFATMFGYRDPQEIVSLPSLDALYTPQEIHRIRRLRSTERASDLATDRFEIQGVRKDGTLIWVEIQFQVVNWTGEPALQLTVADITLRKAYEAQLQRQANFDEVTGLPNRVLAQDRLRGAVVSALRHQHKGGVFFIDLDHFKKINDTWGHSAGDQLLRMAADKLRSCVREEDTVARLGGDEFTVILPNITHSSHTEPVIHKILNAFSMPFVFQHTAAYVTASIGVTVFPDDGDDPHVLMKNADAAMYRAKEQGRNTFRFFTPEMNKWAMERIRIETHLLHALERNEFLLHYQPIINVRSGKIVGAEALLRWSNPHLGDVEPESFVPLAEDTGLIAPIGAWVLRTACRQLAEWHQLGFSHLRLSVNISSRQFRGMDLIEAVTEAINQNSVPSDCLELEITEGCLMDELPTTKKVIDALSDLSVRIALDDFGTGYSCLRYLKDFPVNTVKIDKSFVFDVPTPAGEPTVVEAIIAMARRLGIQVVGEGVETEAQLDFLRSRGCELAQGNLLSEPLPADAFAERLRTWMGTLRRAL